LKKCFWYGCKNEAEKRESKSHVLGDIFRLDKMINIPLCTEHNIRSHNGDIEGMLPEDDTNIYVLSLERELGCKINIAIKKALDSGDLKRQKYLVEKYKIALKRSKRSKYILRMYKRLK